MQINLDFNWYKHVHVLNHYGQHYANMSVQYRQYFTDVKMIIFR